MKTYSTEMKALLESPNGFSFCHCFKFYLKNAGNQIILRLTESAFNIIHKGEAFISTNLIDEIDATEHNAELTDSEYQLTFTAIDQTLLSLFLNNDQRSSEVTIERVLLKSETSTSIGALLSNSFIISSYSTDGETLVVRLKDEISLLMQPKGITTSMESFRRFYPNTTSCINSSNVKERFKWAYD